MHVIESELRRRETDVRERCRERKREGEKFCSGKGGRERGGMTVAGGVRERNARE